MKKSNKERVEQQLIAMYEAASPFLNEYPWEREGDRWGEMLICLLIGIGIDPNQSRKVVETLKELELISATDLANADKAQQEFIRKVFLQTGFGEDAATKAASVILAAARYTRKRWAGYIQRFLRKHGELMANELKATFTKFGLDKQSAGKVALLWLQNVANIPILLPQDPHIQNFCRHFTISPTQLLEISDRLGLNVSVLDDLLALELQFGAGSAKSKRNPRHKRAQ